MGGKHEAVDMVLDEPRMVKIITKIHSKTVGWVESHPLTALYFASVISAVAIVEAIPK